MRLLKCVLKKYKEDERGIVIRNKARLVAQGYTQEEVFDYEEVIAPVARIEAIRLFLAYASYMGFTVYQMDVKSSFLYETIDEEEEGYRMAHHAPSAYVDDIIFGSSNLKLCKEFEALMHDKFKMSAMGELTFFLRLQVLQKNDGIFISQDKYIGDILKKFGYTDVRTAKTPWNKEILGVKYGPGKDVDLHLYRSMIGSLMYLTVSRPDIMFAICVCSRHQVTPKECYLHAVKRIFRYLKGQPLLGFWYPKESLFDLVAYSDSDYDGDNQDRKSTTRGCQFLGRSIGWLILEEKEHNTDFTQIVDFLKSSPLRVSKKISMSLGFYEKLLKMSQFGEIQHTENYHVPSQTAKVFTTLKVNSPSFSGRNVDLFESMLVPQGEGPVNLSEPHHTPSPQASFPQSQEPIPYKTTTLTTSQEPTSQQISTPSHTPTPRRLSKRAIWIAQSKALTPGSDEPASPLRDGNHGEAFPTATSLDAGQDRENIPKTSAMPHESSLMVTSLGGDEGSLQLKLNELMDFCTKLQSQHSQMAAKIQRIATKALTKGVRAQGKWRMFLSSIGVANILASGGLKEVFTTASLPVPPQGRKGQRIMIEPANPTDQKVHDQLSEQLARELE
ncbi:putative ribonuclease H-like domain-containing protein [Tanacetum coccineum]